MFGRSIILFAAAVFLIPADGRAQDVTPGTIVTPKGDLTLRDAPPGGLIGLKGDAIGNVTPSTNYKVIEQKSISTILGGENWIKLQPVGDPSKSGWVFSGTKSSPAANVQIKSQF